MMFTSKKDIVSIMQRYKDGSLSNKIGILVDKDFIRSLNPALRSAERRGLCNIVKSFEEFSNLYTFLQKPTFLNIQMEGSLIKDVSFSVQTSEGFCVHYADVKERQGLMKSLLTWISKNFKTFICNDPSLEYRVINSAVGSLSYQDEVIHFLELNEGRISGFVDVGPLVRSTEVYKDYKLKVETLAEKMSSSDKKFYPYEFQKSGELVITYILAMFSTEPEFSFKILRIEDDFKSLPNWI